jgi:hypothetical protein
MTLKIEPIFGMDHAQLQKSYSIIAPPIGCAALQPIGADTVSPT